MKAPGVATAGGMVVLLAGFSPVEGCALFIASVPVSPPGVTGVRAYEQWKHRNIGDQANRPGCSLRPSLYARDRRSAHTHAHTHTSTQTDNVV